MLCSMRKAPKTRAQTSSPDAANDEKPLRLSEQARISAFEHPGLQPNSLLVVLALYRAFAVLDRDQSEEIAQIGLNPTQFNILMSLHRLGRPLAMGELAALLVVKPSNLSGIVNTLCERGLARREINTSDQRSLVTVITPAGERMLASFIPRHWAHLARIMGEFREPDRVALVNLLRSLIASIENSDVPATEGPRRLRTANGRRARPGNSGRARSQSGRARSQ
jgi:DNA-binding MarR family transcriptional regulator